MFLYLFIHPYQDDKWACREKTVTHDSESFLPRHFRRFVTNGGSKGKREIQKASLPERSRKKGMTMECIDITVNPVQFRASHQNFRSLHLMYLSTQGYLKATTEWQS